MDLTLQTVHSVRTWLVILGWAGLCAVAGAETKTAVFGPFPHDVICKLTTVQKKGKLSFEIYVDTSRIAQFDQDSYDEASDSAKSLHQTGVCKRVDWDQRSEM